MGGVVGLPDVVVALTGVIRVGLVLTSVVLTDVVTLSPAVEDGIKSVPNVVTEGFVTGGGGSVAFPGVDTGGDVMLDAVVTDAGGVVVAVPVPTDELVEFSGVAMDEPTRLI